MDDLVQACNNYRLKINGCDEIDRSALTRHIFEKLSNQTENRPEALMNLLNALDVKNAYSKPIDINIARAISQEVYNK